MQFDHYNSVAISSCQRSEAIGTKQKLNNLIHLAYICYTETPSDFQRCFKKNIDNGRMYIAQVCLDIKKLEQKLFIAFEVTYCFRIVLIIFIFSFL